MPIDARPDHPCRRLDVFDEDDWTHLATGVELPSGIYVLEWIREAFPEGERCNEPAVSQYRDEDDVRQATGGTLIYEDPNADR